MKSAELIILTGSVTRQATHRIDKHLDGYYTLQHMATGGVELFYDDQRYEMEGAWFWPAYPGPRIRFHPAAGYSCWEHRHIAFRGPLVHSWISEGLFSTSPQVAEPGKDYRAAFDALLAQVQRKDHWSSVRAIHMLEGLLIDLAEARNQPMLQQPWVQELIEHFAGPEANFSPDYALLAQQHGLSLSRFRQQFHQATGLPIHRYVLQCRIGRAKHLLTSTDLPLKCIARQLGYTDSYYFSRQFHELTGVSPTAYRQGSI